ncbi:hypothetical protein Tco_0676396 [Tanacetum coccineum]
MSTLKFADTHNMVAFLSKPTECDRFEQIVDFLNAHPLSEIVITESSVRSDLQLADKECVDCFPNSTSFENLALMGPKTTAWNELASAIIYEAVYKELGDSLVRATTTDSSLKAEQDSGNISDEDRLKLEELMALCTTLQNRVLDLEKTKTTQHNKITSLKRRVKKLEKRNRSRTHKLKRLYKVGLSARVESSGDEESLGEDASKQERKIDDIDADEEITLVNDHADDEMFDVNDLGGKEVFIARQNEEVVDAAQVKTVTITTEEITLAQALEALKTSKPKVKGIVIQEPGTTTKTTTTTISSKQSQDKGKGIMVEPKKPMKKKDQINFDEETAKRLQAEFDEEEILATEKAEKEQEANIALTKEWEDIQAKIEADHELAQRLKHFAAKSAEEKRNKPPTQAQQRKIMCTYLKNIEGKKLKDLKNKSFDSIQKIFDRAFKRVNTFVDFRIDLVEGSSPRTGEELEQESTKKKNVDDDKDTVELQSLMEVIPDEEEVAIDAVPLATKSPTIVD